MSLTVSITFISQWSFLVCQSNAATWPFCPPISKCLKIKIRERVYDSFNLIGCGDKPSIF